MLTEVFFVVIALVIAVVIAVVMAVTAVTAAVLVLAGAATVTNVVSDMGRKAGHSASA